MQNNPGVNTFKNLLEEICHLNIQRYKNLFSQVKSSCFYIWVTVLSEIMISTLPRRLALRLQIYITRNVIKNKSISVIPTSKKALYKEFMGTCKKEAHRRTGNFLLGGAVNHLPKKFLQVAQIFTKQTNRNEGHTMQQHRRY